MQSDTVGFSFLYPSSGFFALFGFLSALFGFLLVFFGFLLAPLWLPFALSGFLLALSTPLYPFP